MVKKKKKLIGKTINLQFDDTVINSYKITDMLPTIETLEGRGKLYKCSTDWENKNVEGAYPMLEFDAQTLDELLKDSIAVCPFMPNLKYRIT